MPIAAKALLGLLAVLHVGFLVLEMFLFATPRGRKIFGTTPEQAENGKVLAKNQGLYNGFLAAGCVYAIVAEPTIGRAMALFIVSCILVAGLYGGATASKTIFFVQALPAAIALATLFL